MTTTHRALVWVLAGCLGAVPLRAQDACGEREPPPGPLVSADWLKRHRGDKDLVLLQVERSRAVFDSAHIAGARLVLSAQFAVRQGDLITELPPVARLDSLFESLGVGDRGRIVLYGDLLPATRLFFTLDYLGLGDRVSVLNGGLLAWSAAGGATTTAATPPPTRTALTVRPRPELLADAGYLRPRLNQPTVLLLDARTQDEFDGAVQEEGVSRAGHIPGAVRLEWSALLQEDGRFLGRGELRQLFAAAGAQPGREIVAYCRVGSRASALYFAARVLGYPVRLYDGSMNDWAARAELPVDKKP